MKFSNFETITNEALFVESHLATINNNKMSERAKQPYRERLERYYLLKKLQIKKD